MLVNINRKPYQIAVDDVDAPVVVVVSHERSGTHFLMNSIAMNSRYTVDPFLNFDHQTLAHEVNFPRRVGDFFDGLGQNPVAASFCKASSSPSHPCVFQAILGRENVRVLYRHPVDTLVSLWRFLHRWEWNEGLDKHAAYWRRGRPRVSGRYRDRPVLRPVGAPVQGWLEGRQHQNVVMTAIRACAPTEAGIGEVLAFLNQPLPSVIRPPPRDSYIQGQKRPLTEAQRAELVLHVAVELARYPVVSEALIGS